PRRPSRPAVALRWGAQQRRNFFLEFYDRFGALQPLLQPEVLPPRKRKCARAIATRNMLLAGRDDSIDAMALRLGVRRDYVAVLVRLSYLSPEIVRAILVGQHPIELTPTRLVALPRNLPHDWQEQ